MPKLQFEMKVGDSAISAAVTLPDEAIRPVDLLPVLHVFNDALIGVAVNKVEAAGEHVSCRAGCGACCRQVVPISETEAFHLAEVVAAMPEDRKSRVTARFAEVGRALAESGLLDRFRSAAPFPPGELRQLGVEYFQLGLACPFLEDESCSIHPDRPASCREYLVTSPAVNCATPRADNISTVALPTKLSRILYRFGDGVGDQPTRWVLLSLLLEWTANHTSDAQPVLPGPQLLENFMNQVARK